MAQKDTLLPEMDPSRYIEKVSLVTGEVLDQEILPKQLLVGNHRDYHIVDVHARHMMSRVVKVTGSEEEARRRMKERRRLGHRASRVVARAIGEEDTTKVSKSLFGLKEKEYYFRYKRLPYEREDVKRKLATMKSHVAELLEKRRSSEGLGLRVLLTGGTGFVGKETIFQAAHDPDIDEMVILIRPKHIRDHKTGEVLEMVCYENVMLSLAGGTLALGLAFGWMKLTNGLFIAQFFLPETGLVPGFEVPTIFLPASALYAYLLALPLTLTGSLYTTHRTATIPPMEAIR